MIGKEITSIFHGGKFFNIKEITQIWEHYWFSRKSSAKWSVSFYAVLTFAGSKRAISWYCYGILHKNVAFFVGAFCLPAKNDLLEPPRVRKFLRDTHSCQFLSCRITVCGYFARPSLRDSVSGRCVARPNFWSTPNLSTRSSLATTRHNGIWREVLELINCSALH